MKDDDFKLVRGFDDIQMMVVKVVMKVVVNVVLPEGGGVGDVEVGSNMV